MESCFLIEGTIIFSIHQPRYAIFRLFDSVLFLSAGHCIYFGSPLEVIPYFASQGFVCNEHDNPADFVLDILIESNNRSSTKLQTGYLQSNMHSNLSQMIENENENSSLLDYDLFPRFAREFSYITQRTFCDVLRNPALVASQMISVMIYGLFTGLIFNQLETSLDPGVYNRFGAIFFIISCQVLGAVSALEPLIKERVLFIHVSISFAFV